MSLNKKNFINIKNLCNFASINELINTYPFINSPNEDINNTLFIVIGEADMVNKLNLLESTICITNDAVDNRCFVYVEDLENESFNIIQLIANNFFTAQQININSEDIKMLSILKRQLFIAVSYNTNLVHATYTLIDQLANIDLTTIESAIFNITSKDNLTLSIINTCVEIIREKTNENLNIIFGTGIDNDPLASNIFIMLT